jgi:hypothetical protein
VSDEAVNGEGGRPDEPDSIDDLPSDPTLGPPVRAGAIGVARYGAPTPIYQPTKSTALEDDDPDTALPPAAVWVMKYRRHRTFRRGDDDALRVQLGTGDEAVYVTGDGDDHVMVCRPVGIDPIGVEFLLVGRMTQDDYHDYVNGFRPLLDIFSDASDLALCSVFTALDAVSNVTLVERYRSAAKVPVDYLPPSPYIHFSDDDEDDPEQDG